LIKICRLPQLEELGKNLIMEALVARIQDNTSHRRDVTDSATKIKIYLIEKHLVQPTKVHTMVQVFMDTLSKDMQTLDDNIVTYIDTLGEIT
jgi:hypothetical protein